MFPAQTAYAEGGLKTLAVNHRKVVFSFFLQNRAFLPE